MTDEPKSALPPNPPRMARKPQRLMAPNSVRHQVRAIAPANVTRPTLRAASVTPEDSSEQNGRDR